ncbi:MAG: thymidine phosphorylase [Nitrospirae bacterium]|nr:thymidine phosphorylase [Nitrospirota bacterium]
MARAYDIIKKKRDGLSLSHEELKTFLNAYLKGDIPDYQVSAFLMAVFFKGMTAEETVHLTDIMLHSGAVLDLSQIPGPKIDKHSTGGVGDKVSLILAPLMASAGVIVPMMSGRGLGHTGGTLDKLESIPGFRVNLRIDEFKDVLSKVGCAMIGQTDEIAPLDRRLYSLRDVTATVEAIPLIASSIMSKKLAEGLDGLVLDVKVGSGAFMKTMDNARMLARAMVNIGNSMGVKTVAVITDMNEPLGMAVGNSLEVREAIDALKGEGPEDLMEVTLTLGAFMLKIAEEVGTTRNRVRSEKLKVKSEMEKSIKAYKEKLSGFIKNGSALSKFRELIIAQKGNPQVIDARYLPYSCLRGDILSRGEGYIHSMNAEVVGLCSMLLGAGRERIDSIIDPAAGILLKKKVGDFVKKGDLLAYFYAVDEDKIKEAEDMFLEGISLGETAPDKRKMVLDVVE